MDLKEKILDDSHWNFINEIGTSSINTKTFPSAYKEQALEAMEELSKIVAIAFGVWMLSEAILPRDSFWFDAGKHLTTDELYQLFTKSKHYQELMDAK